MFFALAMLASAADCEPVSPREVAESLTGDLPAIVVLGERHGHRGDLRRARRLIARLAQTTTVTVALEAVHHDAQGHLDAFEADRDPSALFAATEWETSWGYRFGPYLRLMVPGAELVGAGLDLGPAPTGVALREPPSYLEYLQEALDGHTLAPDVAARFVRSMTWRDQRIAGLSISGWNGEGVLVIVTGRGHVERGLGVPFQLQDLSTIRIETALLGRTDYRCSPVDRVLKGR